jgi:ribosomal protein S18 acetylase RimI-like enzyme
MIRRQFHLLYELQKYMPIRIWRRNEPHYYLFALGTLAQYQRQGIGSALTQPILSCCNASGLPAYLETASKPNVLFYERHGFQVKEIIQFPHGKPKARRMWREPVAVEKARPFLRHASSSVVFRHEQG